MVKYKIYITLPLNFQTFAVRVVVSQRIQGILEMLARMDFWI